MHFHLPKPLHGWRQFVGEVGIIVLGILIALGAEQLVSQRNDAAKHHELMQRLFEESENDVMALRSMRDGLKPTIEREQAFAAALGKGQCPAEKDFEPVETMMMMPALTAPTAVYQELMGAGGLSSIEREDIRDSIALFHYELEWGQKQVDYFRAARSEPVPDSDLRVRKSFVAGSPQPEVVVFDRQALCRDQGFKNRIASATRNHTVFLGYFEGPLEDAISMCVRLGDSLGAQCEPRFGGPLTGADAAYAAKVTAKMRSGH